MGTKEHFLKNKWIFDRPKIWIFFDFFYRPQFERYGHAALGGGQERSKYPKSRSLGRSEAIWAIFEFLLMRPDFPGRSIYGLFWAYLPY